MTFKRYRNAPVELRFWTKVDKTDSCWLWRASTNAKGYGVFVWEYGKGARLAHRIAYEQTLGPVPDGMMLDHTCWDRSCVNPAHLRPVAAGANSQNRKGANRTNSNGFRGVTRLPHGRYQASATKGGTRNNLGIYATAAEAGAAAAAWRRENMPDSLMDREAITFG